MKRLWKLLLAPYIVGALFWSFQTAAVAGVEPPAPLAADGTTHSTPDLVVLNMTTDVLDTIRKDKSIQAGDFDHLQKLVEERILPHVDFDRMTRMAVGRPWAGATGEQRSELIKQFRLLLIHTYGGVLSRVTDEQVRLRPFHNQTESADVLVRAEIASPQSEPVELDFRLEKIDADWKVYDVDIMGIWLIENYRVEFAAILSRGGMNALIQALSEKNQRLASATRKS
jgi:phospholipid transport system substrate-binding protein